MEFVEGGNIFDHMCKVKRFEEETVKFIAA